MSHITWYKISARSTLMTDFGCPYRCSFCVMSTLGWKFRPIQNVIEELEHLSFLDVSELFFLDQTFGLPRERALRLLDDMSQLPYRFGWVCFSRPDVLDPELLSMMRKAGCHTVILGLESGNQEMLQAVKKDYSKDQVRAGFELCREQGLRTVATILLGLPEETRATFEETMRFLREIDPDFASFNVVVPRMGTPIRQKALRLGLIEDSVEVMDQSGTEITMPSLTLTRHEIASMRRKAIRDFYFRFGYLTGRLRRSISTRPVLLSDLRIQFRQGYQLLRNYLR